MSFFNVTQLGVQDPIKTAVNIPSSNDNPNRVTLSEPVYPNSESNGSHVKYTERLHKHIRPQQGTVLQRKLITGPAISPKGMCFSFVFKIFFASIFTTLTVNYTRTAVRHFVKILWLPILNCF